MAFDIADAIGGDAGGVDGAGDGGGLTVDAGGEVAGLGGAVIVDGGAFHHGPDMVAIGDGILKPAQRHHARAAAENRALGAVVESVAVAVGGEDFVFLEEVTAALGQFDGGTAGERHVALAGTQGLAGVVDGDQRG